LRQSSGDGGVGVKVTAASATITNSNRITGGSGGTGGAQLFDGYAIYGNPGTGGTYGQPGVDGKGGAGITGSNLTIVNSGSIAGGIGGNGQANAIAFNGGANSLNFISSVNLNPTGNANSPTYTFSFNVSQIGLAPNSGASFFMLGTYTSDSGYRSDEAIAGNDVGAQGWNPFLQTAFVSYTIVPEPSAASLLLLGVGALFTLRRRK